MERRSNEEVSGSVLLAIESARNMERRSNEEVSGSVLLAIEYARNMERRSNEEVSGSVLLAIESALNMERRSNEEVSGSFLLAIESARNMERRSNEEVSGSVLLAIESARNMERRSNEEVSGSDGAFFSMIEEFIEQKRDEDYKCGSKRKRSVDHPKLSSVFTPEWREAVTRFAQKIPMELLIREFNRYYNISISKGTSDKDCEALVEKGDELIHFPDEVMANILSKMSVTEVLTSWSISHHWAAVCASQQFQSVNGKTENFIVINNSNLDMWAFSIASKRWLLLNMPCDWEKLGMKTLGVKATCDGLFLVARSDFNLFVVNPVKSQVMSLPTILPHTEDRLKFLESLIVDGTAEMLVNPVTRDFELYLFGNCEAAGESCVHLAQYSSTTTVWTVQPILLHGVPLSSTLFPSPLRSYRCFNIVRRINILTCISSTFQLFDYRNRHHVKVDGKSFLNIPGTIDSKNNEGALPIMVPFNDGAGDYGFIWVGRLKGDESGKGMFGKLPILPHFSLGIWKFSERQWEMIDTIKAELIEDMIKSSEGTDFLIVGDGRDTIWLMLRGSESMVQYNTRTKESLMLPGCPGGGYMDTNFHWKALLAQFRF